MQCSDLYTCRFATDKPDSRVDSVNRPDHGSDTRQLTASRNLFNTRDSLHIQGAIQMRSGRRKVHSTNMKTLN